jgi:hypothetical protein
MFLSSIGFTGHPTIRTLITNAEDPDKRGRLFILFMKNKLCRNTSSTKNYKKIAKFYTGAVLGAVGALQSLCTIVGKLDNFPI